MNMENNFTDSIKVRQALNFLIQKIPEHTEATASAIETISWWIGFLEGYSRINDENFTRTQDKEKEKQKEYGK